MSHVVAVLATVIGISFIFAMADVESDKRTEKAGFIIIGENTYRLVKVSNP